MSEMDYSTMCQEQRLIECRKADALERIASALEAFVEMEAIKGIRETPPGDLIAPILEAWAPRGLPIS